MSRPLIVSPLVALALSGCISVGPNYKPPASPLPSAFRASPVGQVEPTSTGTAWWAEFGDPLLTKTVEESLAQNLDLDAAAARVTQARAAARAAGAALLPAGQLQGDASRAQQSLVGSSAQSAARQRDIDLFDAGIGASWELDLFGGNRRGAEASKADAAAAEAGLAGARLMIAAETADAYIQLRGFQSRLALAERQVQDAQHLLDLTKLLVKSGHSAPLQLDQAEALLAQTQASTTLLRVGQEVQLNRLAVLCARPPEAERGALAQGGSVPDITSLSVSRGPADLLRQRPDVVAAERKMAASNARIGLAVADYYPKIDLQALIGFQSLTSGNLFSNDAKQAQGTAGLRWRLFDFGRVDAEVAAARGAHAEALANWRNAVLTAAEDVENAIVQLNERSNQVVKLEAASQALKRSHETLLASYARGAVSQLEVIDTERQWLGTEDAEQDSRTQRARAVIALHRAMGG